MSGKTVKRFFEGDTIPADAQFIRSERIPDYDRARYEWLPTPGIMGALPIFGTETLYRLTPFKTVYYYEVSK